MTLRAYFSTVVRAAPVRDGGELVRLNWDTGTVEAKVAIYPKNPEIDDPNPRGNTRGGRGIALIGDHVVVASYHTLEVYDRDLNHLFDVTHPLMAGLHEIHASPNGSLWVSSTAIDAALEIDLQTGELKNQFWPREMPGIKQALSLEPLEIDKQVDNRALFVGREHAEHPSHTHLNAIACWRDDLYALFNTFGVVANLSTGEIVLQDSALISPHNLIIREDGTLITNNTLEHSVNFYDIQSGSLKRVIGLSGMDGVRELVSPLARPTVRRHLVKLNRSILRRIVNKLGLQHHIPSVPLFVRGLDLVGEYIYVGISPAAILQINWQTGELHQMYQYSEDVRVCVHGLQIVRE